MSSSLSSIERAARFATVYALLRAASAVGDHWLQSSRDAALKGALDRTPVERGGRSYGTRAGQAACARHCFVYTATQAAVVLAGARVLRLPVPAGRLLTALAVSGLSHYALDRREPLRRLAFALGKGEFHELNAGGLSGRYCLDQTAHQMVEAAACLLLA